MNMERQKSKLTYFRRRICKKSERQQRLASTDNKVRIGLYGTSASISEQHSGTLGTIHPFSATIRRFPEIIIRKWGKIPHHLICLLFSLLLFIITILSTLLGAFSFEEMAALEWPPAFQRGPPSAFFEHDPRQLNTKTRAATKPSSLSPSHTSEMLFVGPVSLPLRVRGSKYKTKPRRREWNGVVASKSCQMKHSFQWADVSRFLIGRIWKIVFNWFNDPATPTAVSVCLLLFPFFKSCVHLYRIDNL